jgi:hypothetical protein
MHKILLDLPLVLFEGQSLPARGKGGLRGIVVPAPQPALCDVISVTRAKSLLTYNFRVAISAAIGFWPFDCAFRDVENIRLGN